MSRVRKQVIHRELTRRDGVDQPCPAITRLVGMAVFQNPFAGRFEADLSPLFDTGAEVAQDLIAEMISELPGPVVSYGKAAVVGVNGDFEHGGAVIHPKLGAPLRDAIGGGKAVIPSNVKIGTAGTTIDIPLGHKDDPWSFDHFDTISVMISDAPRPNEIVLCVAVADGARPIPRCGKGPIKENG